MAVRMAPVLEARGLYHIYRGREVDVETGLTDGTNTEIVGGLSEGDKVVTTPVTTTTTNRGGPFGGG